MVEQLFYLLTLILPLITILIVFGMKYWSQATQSRATQASADAFRALSEKAIAAQQDSAASLEAVRADVVRLTASINAIENILKQVG